VEKYHKAEQATDENIIQHMHFACWITTATDTHSEYVVLIAFPQQQWLHERTSMQRFMYTACLVYYLSFPKTDNYTKHENLHFLFLYTYENSSICIYLKYTKKKQNNSGICL
jgi:hypothetical protein